MATTFKEEFFSLAKFLDKDARILHEHLGKYDEKDEDEHRTYVWFNNNKALFYVPNSNTVRELKSPISGAYGSPYLDNPDYFTIDGLVQGMTKNVVKQIWGQADEEWEYGLRYKSRGIITDNGINVPLVVNFSEGKDYVFVLTHFSLIIPEKIKSNQASDTVQSTQPKGGCFIATVCYGNYEAPEVLVLRKFRDNILLKSNFGKSVVDFYYFLSPPFARLIGKSDIIKNIIRKYLLNPIIYMINSTNK